MTATCASPIARRICSPVSRALDAGGRLLLEHPLEGRAHLVQVALGQRVDRHLERRAPGRRSRASRSPWSRDDERVAGLGHAELGDGADLAGAQLGRRLLLLAVEVQQLADALVLALGGVEHRRPGS